MSAIPGPWSSKVRRRPAPAAVRQQLHAAVPPAAVLSVLRASSLAAVTILVWSTRLKPDSHRPLPHRLAHPHDVVGGADRSGLSPLDRSSPPLADAAPRTDPRSRSMPRSTLSAVRTPGSESPSSTSVMATAGCMPDDDRLGVEHARHRRDVGDHAADERVHHLQRARCRSARPGAPVREIRSVRSSWSVRARRSCMSTWIVTSRKSPIRRIGMRSTAVLGYAPRRGDAADGRDRSA